MSSICLPINFTFMCASIPHSVPYDDVISTSACCISRQDFPCRGHYRHKVRYNGATIWSSYVLSCSRKRRVFSVPWEYFVGFFIWSDRRVLHYRDSAGSLGIILKKRQRDSTPRETSQRGETSWNVNAKSSGAPTVDPSNLLAKIMLVHMLRKILVFLRFSPTSL